MAHPLVLALFRDRAAAATGADSVRALGVEKDELSVVARSHETEEELAREFGGTPGTEIEDSRMAARLGELGGQVLAAIALILPGIGPIITAGPLSADLGEAAGHLAGGLDSVLRRAGLTQSQSRQWERRVREGAVMIGVHVLRGDAVEVRAALKKQGAQDVEIAEWE
jgi:hypothetical protein